MMRNINLLPDEYKVKTPLFKFFLNLKKIALVELSVFFVILGSLFGYFLYLKYEIDISLKRQEVLKNEVKSLEKEEQQFVLIKDRLRKIENIISKQSQSSTANVFVSLRDLFPLQYLQQADMGGGKIEITFLFPSADILTQFLSNIVTQSNFNEVKISSFSFAPDKGYLVSFYLLVK